ncbi:MAG: DinB family protein [Terriglobia bacterium]
MTKNDYYDCLMEAYRPAANLIRMVPPDKLHWRPGLTFMSFGQLICHLTEPIGDGLRCLITNQWPFTPEQMEAGMKLENIPSCGVEQALNRLEEDKAGIREVLDGISEEDFAQKQVSAPWGWKGKLEIMAVLFREHFTNHKMQLFTYLKLFGLPVDTATLYMG